MHREEITVREVEMQKVSLHRYIDKDFNIFHLENDSQELLVGSAKLVKA